MSLARFLAESALGVGGSLHGPDSDVEIFWELKLLFRSISSKLNFVAFILPSVKSNIRPPPQFPHPNSPRIFVSHKTGKMLSLRNLARAAPRAVPRLTPTVARALPRASPVALRTAAFSTARVLRSEKSELEQQLSAKLGDEIQFEAQVEKEEQMPSSIQDFIDEGKYEILDVEGKEEVKLVRNYGNEK